MRSICVFLLALVLVACNSRKTTDSFKTGDDWPVYGGNNAGNRYSPLKKINTENVGQLQVAWTYNAATKRNGEIQCQPIVVNGILYGTTTDLSLFALDAATGREVWKFTPAERPHQNRGVVYWESGNHKRILYTAGPNLYAVNAINGKSILSFGDSGKVDLHAGLQTMEVDVSRLNVNATSPGVVYKNILIMGSTMSESGDAPPGHIRAFDIVSGKLKWVFHTIPQPGEFGYETWPKDAYKKIGATNCWSGLSLDEKRGTVYFGTASPAVDFYGGDRKGTNLFANCIMALNAETGERRWHYQTISHDLWDRDMPCPPNLTSILHDNKKVDVVVQSTKDGLVYVLDRDSGNPIFPVEERSVPTTGALPGEYPNATQKFPVLPLPLNRQVYTEADLPDRNQEAHDYVKQKLNQLNYEHKFLPPSLQGTVLFGYSGGAEWGGNSIDPNGVLYQNANEEPWELVMQDTADIAPRRGGTAGSALYLKNCAGCHGAERRGSGPELPSLLNLKQKYNLSEVQLILRSGKGRMPAFQQLSESERTSIASFVLDREETQQVAKTSLTSVASGRPGTYRPAFVNKKWERVTDHEGYPGIKPPWGTLNAIDLNTGEYLWRVPLGEYPELVKKGVPVTGTVSYGGPLVTAGGLLFIAGTKDEKFRAFDVKSGKQVWQYQLPAGGFATPITYQVNGKQFIVIAAGGNRGQKPGGNYIAFAL